jgi:serine/threonine protein kinase
MEYCEYGNLYSYQYGMPDKVFKLSEAVTIFAQLLRGLKAIHQENIIHRDLKC